MKLNLVVLSILLTVISLPAVAAEHAVNSPDGKVKIQLNCSDSKLSYSLAWQGRALLKESAISILPDAKYSPKGHKRKIVSETWKTVWGQFSEIHDNCRQLTLTLDASGVSVDLIARVYNDGIAFRFRIPEGSGNARFLVEHNPESYFQAYWTAGERTPPGPVPISKLGHRGGLLPLLLDAGKKTYLGMLESDLYSARGFPAARFSSKGGILQTESRARITSKGLLTPWRVVLIGDQPGALLTSTTPLNLAAECKVEDTSWIKPGTCLWDWRVHGYKAGEFRYGIDSESYKRFIDFAARNRIPYFLIDDTWFQRVENGKLVIKPTVDIKGIMKYADEKGVDIILYYDRKKGGSLGDNALFKLYSELGAAGIKYGFMGNNAKFTRMAVEQSAANNLLVDFHDNPCPMTGIERTLPNAVTREFCHAQQDARRAFSPSCFLKMAMINALSGPLDQNNGAYGLNGINNGERAKGPSSRGSYNSTVVSETARVLVIHSGLIVLPDAPEEYEKKADLFEFIREMPGTWDESIVINSSIGKHITTARRSKDQWFVGSVINEKGGTLKIPLDFLEAGKKYDVTFYEDTPETHYIKNRESYSVRKGTVKKGDIIEAKMSPGGGHCMWIRNRNG
jgi:alpha-glucosidase